MIPVPPLCNVLEGDQAMSCAQPCVRQLHSRCCVADGQSCLQRKSVESLHTAQRMRVQRYNVLSPSSHREQYNRRTLVEVQKTKGKRGLREDGEAQPDLEVQKNKGVEAAAGGAFERSSIAPRQQGRHFLLLTNDWLAGMVDK